MQTFITKRHQEMKTSNENMNNDQIYSLLSKAIIDKVDLLLQIPDLNFEHPHALTRTSSNASIESKTPSPSLSRNTLSMSSSSIRPSKEGLKRAHEESNTTSPRQLKRAKTMSSSGAILVTKSNSQQNSKLEVETEEDPSESRMKAIQKIRKLATTMQAVSLLYLHFFFLNI